MPNPITTNPKVIQGEPVFAGTQVHLKALFDYLHGGYTLEDFLKAFPKVPRELAIQALKEDDAKLVALRAAIDEGDASGIAEGDVFERVRRELNLPD